jgi:succinate-semialdehyde dehydrogenase / glutarate-semialdehyde dehydrogenase
MPIQTINPATGQALKSYPECSDADVDKIIQLTHQAQTAWREQSFAQRAELLNKAADALEARQDEFANLIADEMGKPITAGRGEIKKCAWVCRYYAENGADFLADRPIQTEMQKSYVTHKPLGIVYAIMPWNFPFWQVFRFAAPNLMAGNGALLNHAPITTGSGLAIEALLKDVGFPENLFRTLVINYDTSAHVIAHPKVRAVTLTGSARAGRIVGSEAATALKKVVLELGGSDPYLILEDADLELASEACITSRLNNAGQVCIAAKRIIVCDSVYDEFEKLIIDKMARYQMGEPRDEATNFGPMAREDLRAEVHRQVQATIDAGAECVMGGTLPEGPGFYYPPTLLRNIQTGSPALTEEIFGPVVTLIRVKGVDEAVTLANESDFGLASAVFTQDLARGEALARDSIHAGSCFVNAFVASDPRLPFGGINESGYGRELSAEGIHEFVNVKTIAIK